jgi:3-oxoacyl-[acyl-carrier-protein] synthase III
VAIISNAVTIADAGAFSASLGSLTLIKTITISSDTGTVSFVDGASSVVLDDTYPIYQFDFINIHPSEDDRQLQFNMSVDTGSNYNVAKTTTYFLAQHSENNDTAQVAYNGTHDLAQGTGFQTLALAQGNANDEGVSGSLTLFNPSSTTFVKHFTSVTNNVAYVDRSFNNTSAGYGNTTSAVDAIQFKFSGGSIGSGIFKLYGIKDS